MAFILLAFLRPLAALLVGGGIGLAFGHIQDRARRRHEKLEQEGKFKSGWVAAPGAFRRVAYLLVALALVQFLCPILFTPGTVNPWLVSGGLALGYGLVLFRQLRRRLV